MKPLLLFMLCCAVWAQSGHNGHSGISGTSTEQPGNTPIVTSMAVSPQAPVALVNVVVNFSAIVTLSNGAQADGTGLMNWLSTSPVIASIGTITCNANNQCVMPVTCNSAGAAQIQADFGSILQASSTLTCNSQVPPPPTLVSIAVTPALPAVNVGQNQQFTATGTYSDGTTKDITSAVTWASATTTVATMDGLGPAQQANCIKGGTSVISATDPTTSILGNTTLTCNAVLTSITVAPSAATILVGAVQQFSATCNYNDGTTGNCSGVTWNSSNLTVATITSGGLATGLVAGTSNVDAVLGTITSNVSVLTVQNPIGPPTLVSIAVTPVNSTINVGAQLVYTATCTYSDGSTQNCSLPSSSNPIVWASSATGVATISTIGVATGVAGGSTTISATITPIAGSTGLTVQAPPTLVSIAVTPTNPTQTNGSSTLFTATGTYSSGPNQNVTAQATWTFGTAGIATYLAQSGGTQPAQCNNTGSTTTIATIGAISGNTTLTCTPPALITGENAYCGSTTDISCFTGNQTDGPSQLPTHGMYTGINGTPSPGTTITVTSNATMTSALASVLCGQTIIMTAADGPYAGFVLPAKGCNDSNWITIETDQTGASGFPAEHVLITPCADNTASVAGYPNYTCGTPLQLMARVVCSTAISSPATCVGWASGADHYRLIGIAIDCAPTGTTVISDCVGQFNTSNHILFDRSIIHGNTITYTLNNQTGTYTFPGNDVKEGLILEHCSYCGFINGEIYNIGTGGSFSDSAAVDLGGNSCTAGDEDIKKLYGNLLSSTGEDYFAGGGGCGGTVVTPNDFEIRNNFLMKPVTWLLCQGNGAGTVGCHGGHPELKNNGELKNANRVLIEGNTFLDSYGSWQSDQQGFQTLISPKNQASSATVTSSSDSTGTILTGAFSSSVVSPNCAPGGCHITFNGLATVAKTYSAGPPVSITVSPAVTPSLTGISTKECLPGDNPNAEANNFTYRWNHFMNSNRGVALETAVSDCGDIDLGTTADTIHDNLFEGLNANFGGQGAYAPCVYEDNGISSQPLHNYVIEHNTCIVATAGNASPSGLQWGLDATDTSGNGNGQMTQRVIINNIGAAGGGTSYNQGGTYPGGVNNGIVKQSGSSWTFTENVLGIGLWSGQWTGLPYPPSNADTTDSPAGNGCNSSHATCHPSGTAFTSLFQQYNGPAGQPGYLGNYQLNCPGGPYCSAGTDSLPLGVSNWTVWNQKTTGVFTPTTYTPAAITTSSLPQASVGTLYQQNLSANSAGPWQWWSVVSPGILPPGLSLTQCGGFWCISGTPTTTGTYSFTLQMMDAAQQYATAALSISVASSGPSPNANWQLVPTPSGAPEINYFTIDGSNNWYLADRETGNGFWKSTNQGTTWAQINNSGILCSTCGGWSIQWNPHNNSLIAGTIDNSGSSNAHYYLSTNGGTTWTELASSNHIGSGTAFEGCGMPTVNGGVLICGGFDSTIPFYSLNDGATTTNITGTLPPSFYSVTAANPVDGSFWVGSEAAGSWCSTKSQNGSAYTNVWPFNNTTLRNGDQYWITFATDGSVMVGTQQGIYRGTGGSDCGGTYTWTLAFSFGQVVRGLYTDSFGSIYAGHSSGSSVPGTVYRSIDKGQTFQSWATGLPNSLEMHHAEQSPIDGKIYAVIVNGSGNTGQVYSTPK